MEDDKQSVSRAAEGVAAEAVPGGSEPNPGELGYRWPAEWEPHVRTWLAWPHNPDTWPGRLPQAVAQYAALVAAVARFEPVALLIPPEHRPRAEAALAAQGDAAAHVVELIEIPTNDAWIRDHGPLFLQHPAAPPALVDFRYNAWGGKYPPYDLDDRVPARIAARTGARRYPSPLVLEGGSIDTNGQGLVITTESCLLNENRNPGCTRARVEGELRRLLAVERIVWLPGADLEGDDTDGHIDQQARFVGADHVLLAAADPRHDPRLAEALDGAAELLLTAGFRVSRLPLPAPKYCQGHRLPASYCNFYLVNGGVLVPAFDDPADAFAQQLLRDCFPEREIVGVPCLDLVWGLGAIHCLTQQEPVATGTASEVRARSAADRLAKPPETTG